MGPAPPGPAHQVPAAHQTFTTNTALVATQKPQGRTELQ